MEPDLSSWTAVLDHLEADLEMAEQALQRREEQIEVDTWLVPTLATPLPHELVERASALVARQVAILDRIPEALSRARRQQAVTARIGQLTNQGPTVPVYIDASA